MVLKTLFCLTFLTATTKLINHGNSNSPSRVESPPPPPPTTNSAATTAKLKNCNNIDAASLTCAFNSTCVYGELNTVQCHLAQDIPCEGDHSFKVTIPCLYCWQLPENHYACSRDTACKPHTRYETTCMVNSDIICMGRREFNRYKQCDSSSGHKWSMALVLSILFGGFGVDRFYLGHWRGGVSKIFSFGGFGVWTLIDSILIAIGYLKPVDSSHYEL